MPNVKPVKNIRLTQELWDKIESLSKDEDRTLNSMITQLVKRGIYYTEDYHALAKSHKIFNNSEIKS